MDQIDIRIIQILREDARISNIEIGKRLGLTEGAIRSRIRKLVESGVIKRFTVEASPDPEEAIVLIKTATKEGKDVLRRIRKYANRLFETAGEYDVAAYLTGENIQVINTLVDKLRAIEGVISTLTLLKIADHQ